MASIKKARGIRHDRHCHPCRAEGIKCDLNRPRCHACQQTGATCSYPQRVVWMGDKKDGPTKKTSPSPTLSTDQYLSASNTTQEKVNDTPVNLYGFIDLLSHFYQEIESKNKDLPDEAVKLISRTLSFAHSRLQGSDNKQSIQTHLGALTNLSKVIDSGHPIALFGIATFAIFEVCCGSFGQWHRHLQGARSLLDLHCRNKTELDTLVSEIPGLADVLAYLVWFDLTGALVGDRALIFDALHRQVLSPAFFDSVGCPSDTFDLLVDLASRDIGNNSLDLSSRAMEQILQLDTSDSTDRGLSAAVYRCTGAIVAFDLAGIQNETFLKTYTAVLSKMVDRACDGISRVVPSSRFYVHLASPAYLTGMHATKAQQCDSLRDYWRNCQLCDFPRYPDAQDQCERRWRDKMIV
ncbi:Protein of unknown function DUF3468 [Penicillium angulare]|uniref:Protein of unknown function DUF3468 n=1 Tax=Penicillium angulare TaxID=116970 RepID=UPI002540C805|nr:Protein of unknown function DUF3468 [Penicillium angulare]KAJ5289102.1 Protein of unknown function DUF3468 [Penicillium angulare]